VAIALLQQEGFSVGDVNRVEREVPANTVLEQDPAASPPAEEAALDCAFLGYLCSKPEVSLTVSAGPGSAKIPSTAGLTRNDAEARLEAAGFEPQVELVNSERVEAGDVIRSEPSGGTTLTRGSAVLLSVSKGPKLINVPVLVGSQRSVAVQRIRARGLEPILEEEESAAPEGEVIRQSPSAGSALGRGSSVTIVVSQGEEKVAMPNVIGQLRREAVETLRGVGLSPSVEEEETDVPSQAGRVVDQFPPPDSELEPGDTVTIVVGKTAVGSTEPEEEEAE
jgi:serine/threonine-protein kinase